MFVLFSAGEDWGKKTGDSNLRQHLNKHTDAESTESVIKDYMLSKHNLKEKAETPCHGCVNQV